MNRTKQIAIAATAVAATISLMVFVEPGEDLPGPTDGIPDVQTSQIDPAPDSVIPIERIDEPSAEIGPEEFYLSLSAAMTGRGFQEDYIAAVEALYAGFDPQEFLEIDPSDLAGQLARHLQDEFGFSNVTTDDAADILELAREVFEGLHD